MEEETEPERGTVDPETVERAQRGCPAAMEGLLGELVPPLLALACRLSGNPHDAEDLVTTALYKGSVKLSRLEDPSRVTPWFRRILLNVWKDSLRRKARRELLLEDVRRETGAPGNDGGLEPEAAAVFDPVARAEEQEIRAEVERALDALPPGQRAVMALRLEGDLSAAEIAEALGTTPDRVKANLWHARRRLRTLLRSHEKQNGPPGRARNDAPGT